MNITNETDFSHEGRSFDWVWFVITNVVLLLGITVFGGNALIILVTMKYPGLRKKPEFNPIIAYLAVADCVAGLGLIIAQLDWYRIELLQVTSFTRDECSATRAPMNWGWISGQFMLVWISVDRLTAIKNPLKYLSKDHFKFAKWTFIGTAVFTTMFVCGRFTGDLNQPIPKCTVTYSTTRAYLTIWNIFSVLMAIVVLSTYAAMLVGIRKKISPSLYSDQSEIEFQLEMQARTTRVVSIIVGLCCVLWILPLLIYMSLNLANISTQALNPLGGIVALGSNVSAASNIFVYAYRIPIFKEHLMKLFNKNVKQHAHGNFLHANNELQNAFKTSGNSSPYGVKVNRDAELGEAPQRFGAPSQNTSMPKVENY